MHTQTTPAALDVEDDDLTDNVIGTHGKIDFWRDLAMTEPDQPGGRIAYDSSAYETEEEAEAALDGLFEDIIAGRYEKIT
ncbi:MAG: hypothetical protein WDO56_19080 [Gammaproteobacteria bacterium]